MKRKYADIELAPNDPVRIWAEEGGMTFTQEEDEKTSSEAEEEN